MRIIPMSATLTLVPAVGPEHVTLLEASKTSLLQLPVHKLLASASAHAHCLSRVRVTVVSSTATGGGVSEMLHSLVPLMHELGVASQWLVMTLPPADAPTFFSLTKSLHNCVHSSPHCPTLGLTAEQGACFERVGKSCAEDLLARHLPPLATPVTECILLNDPQPLAMAAHLRASLPHALLVWRCHIGSEPEHANPASREAWAFIAPYLPHFNAAIFSHKAYFPPPSATLGAPSLQLKVIMPAINPSTLKNRALSVYECAQTLTRAGLSPPTPGLVSSGQACLPPPLFCPGARVYLGKGQWQASPAPPATPSAPPTTTPPPTTTGGGSSSSSSSSSPPRFVPFLTRPVVTQVSRWDRLKGWEGLIHGFVLLKKERGLWEGDEEGNICQSALCLAGPDPSGVPDDIEGAEVLAELCTTLDALPEEQARDIFLVLLPMDSAGENSLCVNAIQSSSFVVVQNSLQEGFGLTLTEAMFKRVPVIGTAQALGLRAQVSDGLTGLLTLGDPRQAKNVAASLAHMLSHAKSRHAMAVNGQARVVESGLMYRQAEQWIELLLTLKAGCQ